MLTGTINTLDMFIGPSLYQKWSWRAATSKLPCTPTTKRWQRSLWDIGCSRSELSPVIFTMLQQHWSSWWNLAQFYEACLYLDVIVSKTFQEQLVNLFLRSSPETEPWEVSISPGGWAVPQIYLWLVEVTTDPEKLGAVPKWPLLKDTVEAFPWSVYLLLVHKGWICGEHKVTDSAHGSKVDFPLVSIKRNHILVTEFLAYGTHPRIPLAGWDFIVDTGTSNVGIEGVLLQIQDGLGKVAAYCSRALSKAGRGVVWPNRGYWILWKCWNNSKVISCIRIPPADWSLALTCFLSF